MPESVPQDERISVCAGGLQYGLRAYARRNGADEKQKGNANSWADAGSSVCRCCQKNYYSRLKYGFASRPRSLRLRRKYP